MSDEWASVQIGSLLTAHFSGAWGVDPKSDHIVSTVLRSTDIDNDGHVNLETGAKRQLSARDRNIKALNSGDILLEASGGGPGKPVGRPAWFGGQAPGHYTVSNFFRVLRPDASKVDSRFLLWKLLELSRQPRIWQFQQQTTGIINLKLQDYLRALLDIPALNQQRQIAEILDTLDDQILAGERVVSKIDNLKKGLLQDYIAAIPRRDYQTLGGLCTADICYGIVQPGPYVTEGVPVLAIKDLLGDFETGVHRTSRSIDQQYRRSRVSPGDVLISIKGTIGRVAVTPDHYDGNISRDIARIRFSSIVNPHFAQHYFSSEIGQRALALAVVGTTRAEVSIHVLKQFRFPVPDMAVQDRLAKLLANLAFEHALEVSSLGKLRAVREGLISDLLTGHVRVPAETTS